MVFGSSRGDVGERGDIHDKLAWVDTTYVVIGRSGDKTGPAIKGSLYGSGENGHTFSDASVTMYSGIIGNPQEYYSYRGNVYGGGCGTDQYDSDDDGKLDAYNPKGGIVGGNATVTINGGEVANNIYGAGAMGKVVGNTSVVINTDGAIGVDGTSDDGSGVGNGNVFGAARGELGQGDDYASVTNSSVTLTKGTVKGSIYGGGRAGVVKGRVEVTLNGGSVLRDVYGGGALAETNKQYDASEHPTDTTAVKLAGTNVVGNLYGGGLGRLAAAAVLYTAKDPEVIAEEKSVGDVKTPAVTAVAAHVYGPVTVTVSDGRAANVFGCNNLNGAPQKAVKVNVTGTGTPEPGVAYTINNVYGGGNLAAYAGSPAVTLSGGQVNYVYGGGLGTTAITGGTLVAIKGGTVANDVYGGGSQADVTGNVSVSISGGQVDQNVYGGGALASTNTGNWDFETSTEEYVDSTGRLVSVYREKEVTVGESVSGLYTKSGGDYVAAEGTAVAETTYYELARPFVAGYYTRSVAEPYVYTLVTYGEQDPSETYYRRKVSGTWLSDKNVDNITTYKTTVSLTGGLVGDVYGGGLVTP